MNYGVRTVVSSGDCEGNWTKFNLLENARRKPRRKYEGARFVVNLMTISDVFGLRNFYEHPKACATELGAISSVGRALRLHRRCREFEYLIAHHRFADRWQPVPGIADSTLDE